MLPFRILPVRFLFALLLRKGAVLRPLGGSPRNDLSSPNQFLFVLPYSMQYDPITDEDLDGGACRMGDG